MLLFKLEFKRNLKGLLIWTLVMSAVIMLLMSMYSQYAGDVQSLQQMLQAYPEAMLKVFNMDRLDYATLLGFYAVQGFFMITLVGSIYVVMLASSILAKEESGKTSEFLLSKPIARTRVVGEKALAVLLNIVLFNSVVAAVTWLNFRTTGSGPVDGKVFLQLVVAAPLLLHITFASAAFFFSSVVRKGRNALSFGLGIVFAAYIFNVLAGLNRDYAALKYLSPFQYVNAADIVINGRIEGVYLAIIAAVVGVCMAASFLQGPGV